MCRKIFAKNKIDEKSKDLIEIETIQEFQDYFGFLPELHHAYKEFYLTECFCQADIDATFEKHKIPHFIGTNADYYLLNI